MNKIIVVNDKTKDIRLNDNIEFHIETYDTLFSITNIKIEIKKDDTLLFFIDSDNQKYRINIDVEQDVYSNIYVFERSLNSKVQYSFTLSENAHLCIRHFNKNLLSKQMIEANLIGSNSHFNYNVRKLSISKETSDFYIHHCGENSISNLSGDIVSLSNASVSIQLSTFVEDGCINAQTRQQINLLKLDDGKTELKPNLYIDNNTATIEHNNKVKNIDSINEFEFMTENIYDKEIKEEINDFLERIGGLKNE